MSRRWIRRAAWLCLLVAGSAAAATSTLESVHLDATPKGADVRFHFDHVPLFHWFALHHPPRAIIDFADTKKGVVHDISGDGVQELRLARHADGKLRAVLDLSDDTSLDDVSSHGQDIVAHMVSHGHEPSPRRSSAQSASPTSHAAPATSHGSPKAVYRAEASNRQIVVVIDPGHGGRDPGTHARDGLKEKTVNLAIAKRLYDLLKQTSDIEPVLTRSRDVYVTLTQRVRIAQEHHANLFISIHANSYPEQSAVQGGTCYVLSRHGATDAKAAQLAHFENSHDRSVAGVQFSGDSTLNAVLTDLFQNASIENAAELAHDIIRQYAKVEPIYRNTPPRANFAVLRDPMVPSVLCETAFLSNPHQAALLGTTHFRDELADAMYRAIVQFFHDHPPEMMKSVGGSLYTVKSGETLSGIAASHGVSEDTLMDINHLHSKRLTAGEKLQIPPGH